MIQKLQRARRTADLFSLQGLLLTYSLIVVAEVVACVALALTGYAYMMIAPIVGVSSGGVAIGVVLGVHAERNRWEDPVPVREARRG